MKTIHQICILFVLCLSWADQGLTEPPSIDVYGSLPAVRSLSISPDGKHYAFIGQEGDKDIFWIYATNDMKPVARLDASKFKARDTFFATNNHVILRGSRAMRRGGFRGKLEHSGSIIFNIKKRKFRRPLEDVENLHPAQSGLSRIVAVDSDREVAFVPAYSDEPKPRQHLYQVDLNKGGGFIRSKGNQATIDWFVSPEGKVLAREDYYEKQQEHRIYSRFSGKWELIYSDKAEIPDISVQAISVDHQRLLFTDSNGDFKAVYSMSLADGQIQGPEFARSDREVDYLQTDLNRLVTAVRYGGIKPTYDFPDQRQSELYQALEAKFPQSVLSFVSSTDDNTRHIVRVSGADGAGKYMLFNSRELTISTVADAYELNQIAEFKAIRYSARDELGISAILTFPIGVEPRKNLPLVVVPHGGPESHDSIGFDWLAQFLASRGYLVFQPNFRGSDGFGYQFRNSGRGKWGREMQNDVSDGVMTLVESGYADPSRVCILGASYGGYSALAGGAFSPDLYQCVIAINPVSDLPVMLRDVRWRTGHQSWVLSYWHKVIGDSIEDRDKLMSISPARYAESFQAPVLLIHGIDDTVVPIRQSRLMANALDKAGKQVEFVKLKGEDHWLSSSATRRAMLREVELFLAEHLPVGNR